MGFPLLTRAGQRGQGMTEYIILVALIAVAAIGAYSFFGQGARQEPAQELPGKTPGKENPGAQDAKQGTKGGGVTGESNPAGTPK